MLDYWRGAVDNAAQKELDDYERRVNKQWREESARRGTRFSPLPSGNAVNRHPQLICDKTLEGASIAHCERMAKEGRVVHSEAHGKTCQELVASWDHSDMAKFFEDESARSGNLSASELATLKDYTAVERLAPLDGMRQGGNTNAPADWEQIVTSRAYRLVGAGCCVTPDGTAYICVQLATGNE